MEVFIITISFLFALICGILYGCTSILHDFGIRGIISNVLIAVGLWLLSKLFSVQDIVGIILIVGAFAAIVFAIKQNSRKKSTTHQTVGNNIPESNETQSVSQANEIDLMIGNSIQELDSLIGLENVKQQVHTLIKFIQVQQQREKHQLKTTPISYHCVFSGSPGTGKTTVARILAQIYKDLGVLKKGHLIETDRAGLVGEYVGQTAVKTNKVINSAVGGVLFIDEAYSLYSESAEDYGREAIATLLKRMEDERDNLVVVMAGYTEEMRQFIDINPGLRSRFNRYIDFTDYSPDELYQIFKRYINKEDFKLTPESELAFQKLFAEAYEKRDRTFGNARFVRNVFEKTIERQSLRVADITEPTVEQLTEITENDVPKL